MCVSASHAVILVSEYKKYRVLLQIKMYATFSYATVDLLKMTVGL